MKSINLTQNFSGCVKKEGELTPIGVGAIAVHATVRCFKVVLLIFNLAVGVGIAAITVGSLPRLVILSSFHKDIDDLSLRDSHWFLTQLTNVDYMPPLIGLAIFVKELNFEFF